MSQLQDHTLAGAAAAHAATAKLVGLAADLDDSREWQGSGLASCAHWLSLHVGFEMWTAADLVRCGHALRSLPKIAEAFSEGKLSFDKVRALTQVAVRDDEEFWLSLALQASGEQLGRICRAYRTASSQGLDRTSAQRRKRRLVSWWRDDGMLEMFVTLPPEDATIVLNAIDAATVRPADAGGAIDEPLAARRADALVRVCREAGTAEAGSRQRSPRQLVVHVDAAALPASAESGRCHIENGPALPAAVARRIGCDAEVIAVVQRDGVAITSGRPRRIPGAQLRRTVQQRDGTCRYPGCAVPAHQTDAHHVLHWADAGETSLANLISLCGYHHQRHHEGEFAIRTGASGAHEFVDREGQIIAPALGRSSTRSRAGPAA